MKIPLSWLKQHVTIDVPIRQFMEDITMVGTTAETATALGAEISNVIIGRIVSLDKHSNADKLLVTKVDTGGPEHLQIVTGATNLQVGDYVPVAIHGATLAGGLTIKKGKLRGEVSEGMLCSIDELGYTRQDYPEAPEDGIYVFTQPQPLGADVRSVLELVDDVIEFDLYSNRSDCQSLLGIAREVAATYGNTFVPPAPAKLKEAAADSGTASDFVEVEIQNSDLCPRYVARVVKNVTIGPSPQWLRRHLIGAGVRPINNIVDITNYVMLEYGQPLHAFDIDDITDRKIIVRNATAGEKLTTLDGVERILDETMLVIADPAKAVAIAGVMGGENSKVTGQASAVLFESANFIGTNIRLTSKKLGMRTDASSKFEKWLGIDPNLPLTAINRAMELVEALCCGQVVPGVVDNYPRPRHAWTVAYKPENVNRLLGTDISAAEMEDILSRIGVEAKNGQALIPTFRPDIIQEADIIEEIARFYGYDKIPVNKSQRNITGGGKNASQLGEDKVKRTMAALGYCESMTISFESPKVFDRLDIAGELREAVTLISSLGEDYSIMRTTPLNGMLQSLSTNFNRRNETARLFELAKVYLPRHKNSPGTLPEEPIYLTIGAYSRDKNMDFFDLKGDVEELLATLGISSTNITFAPAADITQLHPGRAATIAINGTNAGYLGELHPNMADSYEISTRVYIAVLDLAVLISHINNTVNYKPLPKYPTISRDIALQVKEDITAASIEKAIREKAGLLLADLALFDIYQGKQIEEGYKSMAYKLSFRAADRTLTDEEVAAPMEKVLKHLQAELGIQLRDK
ncbi:MAG: phenylalanine--tRNA ligase subunit beta [Defluviitaleaceae bacterium]|nr:phenylalanine--tRNA ligase subunit beta [Defluviitaleaceae bacterium]